MSKYSGVEQLEDYQIERAWRELEFVSLASLNFGDISPFKLRRRHYAVYVAFARMQLDDTEDVYKWIDQAISWGISAREVSEIFLAGAKESLELAKAAPCPPPESNNSYQYDIGMAVWVSNKYYSYSYSDGGKVEQGLLSSLRNAEDVSLFSTELKRQQKDWPTRYHLSADRASLLRSFEGVLRSADVLELGCGCGAITRYLGELRATVWGVEGSLMRASIARQRCRDLDNVSIISDKIEDLPFSAQFDIVTLIGVLEYARVYIEAEDPVQYLLAQSRRYLKPGGILIVAIENQLGLKYFAGAPEDHGQGVMAGVNDLYGASTPVTFGRRELERRLYEGGFNSVEVHLPFPDYKMPCLVVHPAGYESGLDWNLGDLIGCNVHVDRQGVPNPMFSLEAAWPVICRNGLVADMANSLLLVARNGGEKAMTDSSLLASHYSPSRGAKTSQSVQFCIKDDEVQVVRSRGTADQRVEVEPYLTGRLHSQLLHDVIQRPGWRISELSAWADEWKSALEELVIDLDRRPEGWEGYSCWLPANTLDAIPRNMVIQASGNQFIDLEWEGPHALPIELVLYRGLVITFSCVTSVAKPDDAECVKPENVISKLLGLWGIELTESDYARFRPVMDSLSTRAQGLHEPKKPNSEPVKMREFTVRQLPNRLKQRACVVTLYWRKGEDKYSEDCSSKADFPLTGREHEVRLKLNPDERSFSGLRLDLADTPGIFSIQELVLCTENGERLWQWHGGIEEIGSIAGLTVFPGAGDTNEVCVKSHNHDPQFELKLPSEVLDRLSTEPGYLKLVMQAYA